MQSLQQHITIHLQHSCWTDDSADPLTVTDPAAAQTAAVAAVVQHTLLLLITTR